MGVVGGSLAVRMEMRRPGSPLVEAVGLTPERYGAELIPQALAILEKKQFTPATFVVHQALTTRTVGGLYPADGLLIESPRTVHPL